MSNADELAALAGFGKRLGSLRRFLGFSEEDLADILDMDLSQLVDLEGGRRQPTFRVLRRISDLTTCDLDFLITGKSFGNWIPASPGLGESVDFRGPVPIGEIGPNGAWYWETDDHYRVTVSSRSRQKNPGTIKGIIGWTQWDYAGADPANDQHWGRYYEALQAHRPVDNFVLSGPNKFVRVSGRPVFDPHGTFRGYRGYASLATLEEAVSDWRTSMAS